LMRRFGPAVHKGLDAAPASAQNKTGLNKNGAAGGLWETPSMAINLKVNGVSRSVPAEPDTPLLYVLRNDLELNGAKFGCGLAQCGACTVLVDGRAVRSCVTPISAVTTSEIITIEGLGSLGKPHALQQAFIAEQAAQCGYCTNGMIMSAKELLDRNPRPSEPDVRATLAGNLCRCGTHNRIVRAVLRAAQANGRT
jgi:nicotinate dehydrogenase subunit A